MVPSPGVVEGANRRAKGAATHFQPRTFGSMM